VTAREAKLIAQIVRLSGEDVSKIAADVTAAIDSLVGTGRYDEAGALSVLGGAPAMMRGKAGADWPTALGAVMASAGAAQ
jgi:hypothetical protein